MTRRFIRGTAVAIFTTVEIATAPAAVSAVPTQERAPAGLPTADTTGTARWRVVETGNQAGHDWWAEVVATGPKNAWVFGGLTFDGSAATPVAKRWNGRSWKDTVLPSGLERDLSAA